MAGVKYGPLVGRALRFVAPACGSSLSIGWGNDRSALTHVPAPLQPPKIFSCKVLWVFFSRSTEQKVARGHFSSKYLCLSAPELLLDPSGLFHFCPSFFGFGHLHSCILHSGILHSVTQFLLSMLFCLGVIQNKPGKAWQCGQKDPGLG